MKKMCVKFICGLLVLMFAGSPAWRAEAASDEEIVQMFTEMTPQEAENLAKGDPVVAQAALFMFAGLNPNPEVINTLIKNGADVNAGTTDGATPLMYAARSNSNPEVINTLIKNGADVNARESDGMTPLMLAAGFNSNPDVIKTLLEAGADANVEYQGKIKALDLAQRNDALKNTEALKMLAAATKFSPTAISDEAFIKLCMTGTVKEVEDAIKAGANVNARHHGMTPLMLAAANNHNPEVIIALVKNGADVNARHNDGITPLMFAAVANSNPEVINMLIKNGADPNVEAQSGGEKYKALDLAQRNDALKNTEALKMLAAATKSSPTAISDEAFIELCRTGTAKEVEDAIKAGANVNARTQSGATPLMFAALHNSNPEVIIALIKNGADVNARTPSGETPLMAAAIANSNPEVITVLMKNGADVKLKDKNGEMAIDYAKSNGKLKNTNALWELYDRSY